MCPGGSPPSLGTSTVTRPNIATITTRASATRRSPLSPPSARTRRSLRWASSAAICVPRVFNPTILLRRRLGHFIEDLIDPIAHRLLGDRGRAVERAHVGAGQAEVER